MVETSNSSYENEIHRVDSLSNEDFHKIQFLAREALISGEGRLKKFRGNSKARKCFVMQIREW